MNFAQRARAAIADENTRSVLSNAILSFGVKGVSLIIALFTTPAYMQYFSDNGVLGIWFTLLAVLSWILSCDMGIGNGLRNKLTITFSGGDDVQTKKLISSAYCLTGLLSFFVIALILILVQFADWNVIFNVEASVLSNQALSTAATITLVAVCLQMVLRLVTSILYAMQKAFVPGLLNLATNTLLLFYVLGANAIGLNGGIEELAFAYLVSVNIPLVVATVLVFCGSLRKYRPTPKFFDKGCAFGTLKLGSVFLWLQIMALLLNSTGSYLISIFLNSAAVVEYQIYYKIFVIASTLVALGATPIWSATTKAQVENNYEWLNKLYKKLLIIGFIAIVCEFLLCLPLQFIFDFWLGKESIPVNNVTALIFAVYGSVLVLSSIVTCFANGLGELKYQLIFLTFGAVLNILLAFVLSRELNNINAIVLANILAYVPYLVVQAVWMTRHLSKHAKECTGRSIQDAIN